MKNNVRKEEILKAAEELFAEKGFQGVSMNEIAEQVRINKSALYYYFKNKREIYDSLIKSIYEKLEQKVREPVMAGVGPKQKIRALVNHLVDFWVEHPRFPSIITREALAGSDLIYTELIPKFWAPMFLGVTSDITEKLSINEELRKLDRPLLIINIFGMSAFYFFVAPFLSAMTREDYYSPKKIEKFKKELLDMIFNGIVAGPR